ncbi:hypothetical protein GBF38_004503 [Nibea albiflora]|uniref:Uncharacterized protein n=1 Tax=Nibea albiflora TaxID=240163 RepID=A0ACB7FCD1_NIBAL|nr:hypothetical protein GBF38_004503 [Nibea albiflora]
MSPVRGATREPGEPRSSCAKRARPVGCRFGLCPVTDGICHGINWFTVTQANELKPSVCVHHRIAAAARPPPVPLRDERRACSGDIEPRDVLRVYRTRPDVIDSLRAELSMEVGETESMLITYLKKFHSHVVEKMLMSVAEERLLEKEEEEALSVARELEDVISRGEQCTAALKDLHARIAEEELTVKDFQSQIQALETKDKNRTLLNEKRCQAVIKASKEKQDSVQQEMDKMTTQLKKMRTEHREAERVLQDAKLELNQTIYEKEQEEVRRMEPYFSTLEVEYNEILEKRRLAEEKRKEEMRVLELKTKAAIFAQAWWRGYSTRKALKNKKNKNKGGKRKKAK